jgi:hypothetical protein
MPPYLDSRKQFVTQEPAAVIALSSETLIHDVRGDLTPKELVDRKLAVLLRNSSTGRPYPSAWPKS